VKTTKIASEWSVPSFAILSTSKQAKALRTGYQQARPIRIKRGIKNLTIPRIKTRIRKGREKACHGYHGSKK
jgi:hypothetical protein